MKATCTNGHVIEIACSKTDHIARRLRTSLPGPLLEAAGAKEVPGPACRECGAATRVRLVGCQT